jgi:hypothetical protein
MTSLSGVPSGDDTLRARPHRAHLVGLPLLARQLKLGAVSTGVCLAAVGFGLVTRLQQLFVNRSLSQDEAMLALNIVHRSYTGLFRQLDFLQGSPIGFLTLGKLAVQLLGENEYSLRLIPFVAGTLALVLFVFLAREAVAAKAVALAVVLFALSDPLVNWTVYAKPYAVDVLLTVLVLWIAFRLLHRPKTSAGLIQFALVGAVAIWLSFASVFVLAAASTVLVGGSVVRRQWRQAALFTLASASWLVSFGIFATTFLGNLSTLQQLQCLACPEHLGTAAAASDTHPAAWRASLGEFRYISGVAHFLDRGNNDLGLLVFVLALVFCAFGLYSLATRLPDAAMMLLAPLLFMLVAWGLHKYPVLGRTQLFLAVPFVLLLAEGISYAVATSKRATTRALTILCATAIALLMAAPTIGHVAHPRRFEDLKPVLDYLARRQRQADTLYVHYTAEYQLRFYLECGCGGSAIQAARKTGLWPVRPGAGGFAEFAPALRSVPPRFIIPPYRGRSAEAYVPDLERLRGRERAWFLLSSLEDPRQELLLNVLDKLGTRLAAFKVGSGRTAAAVYLYDLASRR